jgi:curved DNA-binding protein CbpA
MWLVLVCTALLSLAALSSALRVVPGYCSVLSTRFNTMLYSSHASPTDQSIDPATYVSQDLYGILGVAANASDTDIKKRYLKIVAQTHPDRNSTPEALSIFRNATMAYTTLKDPNLRAKFDQKVKTKAAIDTLETTVVDVVDMTKPLVKEATKKIMEDYLTPLTSTAVEISSAALEATRAANLEDITASPESISLDSIVQKWRAAGDTFNEARLQRRYAVTLSSIQKAVMAEQDAQMKIRSNRDVLLRLNESLVNVAEEEATCGDELSAIDQILKNETLVLNAKARTLNDTKAVTDSSLAALSALTDSLKANAAQISSCTDEMTTLHARLKDLQRQKATLVSEREHYLQEKLTQSAVVEQQQAGLASCFDDVFRLESAVSVASEVQSEARVRFVEAKRERESREAAIAAQLEYGERLETKLRQQRRKKTALYEAMASMDKSMEDIRRNKEREKDNRGRSTR